MYVVMIEREGGLGPLVVGFDDREAAEEFWDAVDDLATETDMDWWPHAPVEPANPATVAALVLDEASELIGDLSVEDVVYDPNVYQLAADRLRAFMEDAR